MIEIPELDRFLLANLEATDHLQVLLRLQVVKEGSVDACSVGVLLCCLSCIVVDALEVSDRGAVCEGDRCGLPRGQPGSFHGQRE